MSNTVEWPELPNVRAIVFDFDGVFTNNKVYVSQDGHESVQCDRGDGLGIDFLRKAVSRKLLTDDIFILSKETNQVVLARAAKLKLRCIHGVDDKLEFLESHIKQKHNESGLDNIIYLGNDLNDLPVIRRAGFSVVPSDAHEIIRRQASVILPENGGNGFVRDFVEILLGINKMTAEEIDEFIYHS